jgi:hypothetical protein
VLLLPLPLPPLSLPPLSLRSGRIAPSTSASFWKNLALRFVLEELPQGADPRLPIHDVPLRRTFLLSSSAYRPGCELIW